jgi:anti-anti-sigma factor
MKISTRQDGSVVVLDLVGRLTGRDAASQVEEAVRTLGRGRTRTVIVNLACVPSIDLDGLTAVADGYSELRTAGIELRLAGFNRRIADIEIVTRLATMCNVFESVEQALEGAIATSPDAESAVEPLRIPSRLSQ